MYNFKSGNKKANIARNKAKKYNMAIIKKKKKNDETIDISNISLVYIN